MDATNDISGLLLLRQHEPEFAFTFPLLTSERGPYWKSTRKYCIFRDGLTQETSGIFMQTVTKKNILMKMDFRFACPSHKQLQNVVRRVS